MVRLNRAISSQSDAMATPARNADQSSDPFADLHRAQHAAVEHGTEAK